MNTEINTNIVLMTLTDIIAEAMEEVYSTCDDHERSYQLGRVEACESALPQLVPGYVKGTATKRWKANINK